MSKRLRRRTRRRLKMAAIGLTGLIVVGGVGAVASTAIQGNEPPPVSEQVSSYYDDQINNKPATAIATATAAATAAASPSLKPLPAGAQVLIMGDSYAQGYGAADQSTQGFAYVLAKAQGWDAVVDAVGGTGFTWDGGTAGKTYAARIKSLAGDASLRPSLVLVEGGQNDYRAKSAELTAAVSATVNEVKTAWPNAQVVVMGPAAPQPLADNLRPTSEAIRKGATNSNVPLVDPVGGKWITPANSPAYALADGSHLNTEGHAFLASKVKDALASLTKG